MRRHQPGTTINQSITVHGYLAWLFKLRIINSVDDLKQISNVRFNKGFSLVYFIRVHCEATCLPVNAWVIGHKMMGIFLVL